MTACYELAGVRLTRQGEGYAVTKDGIPVYGSPWENPLEAWVHFISSVEDAVRPRIGDYLESQGRDRYTGELKEKG